LRIKNVILVGFVKLAVILSNRKLLSKKFALCLSERLSVWSLWSRKLLSLESWHFKFIILIFLRSSSPQAKNVEMYCFRQYLSVDLKNAATRTLAPSKNRKYERWYFRTC